MNTADANVDQQSAPLPPVRVPSAASRPDLATILGLILSFALIISAIFADQSNANFINIPSVLIVILGTITATCVAYSLSELKDSLPVIGTAFSEICLSISNVSKAPHIPVLLIFEFTIIFIAFFISASLSTYIWHIPSR